MASLSGVWNVQDFTDDGAPLVGGRLYTYVQGTTTQKTAYTDAAGTIAHTYTADGAGGQYIALNARGELPAPLYLTTGSYDLLLKRADASTVRTRRADPIGADLAASSGASLSGFIQSGAGAVATTVQAVLRKSEPHNNPVTGALQFEWVNDASALNYASTRAIGVIQHRDTASGATNELIPGVVDQFNVSGNGTVNSGTELSQTIWQGRFMYMSKTGDGSAHSATITGQLGAVGPGGYNELGGYQGEMTNVGSALGTMSGVEMLLKDSPDSGATTYSTKMQAIVGRIAKYNPTVRKSYHFYASSEGTLYTNGIIGVNPTGNKFARGFDFQGADFNTGQFGLAPNNTSLAWLDAAAAARPIIGVSSTNITFIRPASAAAQIELQDFAGTPRVQVTGAGVVAFVNATVAAAATAGGQTLPANPAGFIQWSVNGGDVKIPYYNV